MIETPQLYTPENADAAYDAFLAAYPTYQTTAMLDEWRATEYSRLDAQQQIYLDYTGGGLYAASQLRQHMALLENNVLGNPHSANPTSLAMTERYLHHSVMDAWNAIRAAEQRKAKQP